MIGTFGPLHPSLLMFVCGGKKEKTIKYERISFLWGGSLGNNSIQGRSSQATLVELTVT